MDYDREMQYYQKPDNSIIFLQTPDQKIVQYYTEYDSYNFYREGETVNLYVDKQTGKQYIYDTNKQVDVLIQLAVLQIILYFVGILTAVLQGPLKIWGVVGFLYGVRLPAFTGLFVQEVYTNIIIYNNNPTNKNIPIHAVSIAISIVYLVFLIKLIMYYREAKAKQLTRTLQSTK
ncbi:hypothetical protein [Myroides pelagicus]|uniref:Uncharacterized protein n=1 Tax=Myroides pelagicus TaxID=270914 RepID=A0A7K1GJ57_9FLAO|nr:hypothetical protein [Myroides pelagicus]MTH28925.1 hypothetical protein [Myroides pelagicus]